MVQEADDKLIYIMSQKGTVMDILESKARPYLKRKWTPISKSQFDKLMAKQIKHREQRIDEQRAALEDMDKPT